VVKFEGNYHGAIDSLLAKAGSGVATFGLPDSAGVPAETTKATLLARYNDAEHVRQILNEHKNEVAAIMVEPVAGNMGLVPPSPNFLEKLRMAATAHGVLLVFDEVMTGFRVAPGGATERYGVPPDVTIMGKVIGGGLPVGAYGGRRDLMEFVAPLGPMYQAGTLSGNPLAMAAGLSALEQLTPQVYATLEARGAQLQEGLIQIAKRYGVPAQVQRVGSMISIFITTQSVENFEQAQKTNKGFFGQLFHALLGRGIYLPPSALESWFLTASHSEEDIERTLSAVSDSFAEVLH
jgi:glutamate-1-semialdehyde 2,1-aminomutase